MDINDNERMRRERISEALKHYYQSERGLVHRGTISMLQRLKMAKYGEFLNELNNNNEIKTKNNEESKL
ncbi:hypothetical protein [Bacteroides cellulosilyticus]|uniref:hypothetical protein n=1 Tax=Bacteroides cellulosilyticus TaxID=246787 RepID=UPI0032BFE58D